MLETRVDIKLEQMEQRIDDKAREYNSQILTRFDQWQRAKNILRRNEQ